MQTERTRYRQYMQTEHITKHANRADNSPRYSRCRQSGQDINSKQVKENAKTKQNTDTKGVIRRDGNGKSRTQYLTKIISFSINNITGHGYYIQLRTKIMRLIKNLMKIFLRLKETGMTTTETQILNV